MDTEQLTIEQYLKKMYKSIADTIIDRGYKISELPPGFPISKSTYYNLKKGKGVRTCTILKVCTFLGWPEPRIY